MRMTEGHAIHYLHGDATQPRDEGPRIIAHVCNDLGRWGKGFVLAISKRWAKPESEFRLWARTGGEHPFQLGAVQFVMVEPKLWVANMIGQHDIYPTKAGPPVRYDAISTSLAKVGEFAVEQEASVHMPRIGCGLAGGEWSRVEAIIGDTLIAKGVQVFVYDWP